MPKRIPVNSATGMAGSAGEDFLQWKLSNRRVDLIFSLFIIGALECLKPRCSAATFCLGAAGWERLALLSRQTKPVVLQLPRRRVGDLPQVPTLVELGIPDAAVSPSMALFVPAGTRPDVIMILSTALADVMRNPDAPAALERSRMIPDYQDGPTTMRMYEAEYEQARKIVEKLQLTPEQR